MPRNLSQLVDGSVFNPCAHVAYYGSSKLKDSFLATESSLLRAKGLGSTSGDIDMILFRKKFGTSLDFALASLHVMGFLTPARLARTNCFALR